MMHELKGNLLLEEAVAADAYTEGASDPVPEEVDIKDCRAARMIVTAGSIGSDTDGLVVTLQGADESDGSFEDLEDKEGNTAQITLTESGAKKVEVKYPPRYLKPEISQEADAEDSFAVIIEAGLAENLPVE